MIHLDQTYESYLKGDKKFRIDGIEERIRGYGWHCDGNELKGHYVTTDNYKPVSYTHLTLPTKA